jgi:hypothetical protein
MRSIDKFKQTYVVIEEHMLQCIIALYLFRCNNHKVDHRLYLSRVKQIIDSADG